MSLLRLVFSTLAVVVSCHASGLGHILPAIRTVPIVRYAPFYNFPTGVRSIHAVAPALPAFAPVPHLPAPAFSAPLLPAPQPVIPAPPLAYAGAPFAPAPALPAPAVPVSAFGPVFSGAAPLFTPTLPRFAQAVPALPSFASAVPVLPRLAPAVPALPSFARAIHPLPAVPFAPIIRPAPAFHAVAPAPIFTHTAPAAVPIPNAVPYSLAPHVHLHNRVLTPAPIAPAPVFNQVAWK